MATHSSILAWRIPWTEEPGGLQSMRSQKSDITEATEHTSLIVLKREEGPRSQEMHLPLEDGKDKEPDCSLKPPEGLQPCRLLHGRLLTSRTIKKNLCCFSTLLCGNLLQWQ